MVLCRAHVASMKGVHKATHLVFDDLEVIEFNISYYYFYTIFCYILWGLTWCKKHGIKLTAITKIAARSKPSPPLPSEKNGS